jgi:hypothetical protein
MVQRILTTSFDTEHSFANQILQYIPVGSSGVLCFDAERQT